MKLVANNSFGYQNMDRSRHCIEVPQRRKTHAVSKNNLFKKLDHVNSSLYGVELAKVQIEHEEPIIVGLFILHYAKLRMVELTTTFSPNSVT